MTIDLKQFHEVFFEEASEHLDSLERVLLLVQPQAPLPDEIDALFRAAHSIKGSAGTFGFPDLAEIAHLLENSLDRLRRGKIALTPPLIDAALRAVDLLRRQLGAHRGQGSSDEAALAALPTLLRQAESAAAPPAAAAPALPPDPIAIAPQVEAAGTKLELVYRPQAGAPAEELDRLLNALLDLGELEVSESGDAQAPWSFALTTVLAPTVVADRLSSCVPRQALALSEAGRPIELGAAYGFFPGAPGSPEALPSTPGAAPPKTAAVVSLAPPLTDHVEAAPALEQGSIRVSVPKVDLLVNLMSELVINQAMIAQSAIGLDPMQYERLFTGIEQFERNTRSLQEAVMSLRMLPMGYAFSRFPRVVRDLAKQLGKEVRLVTEGEATELDRGLIEKVNDPLTHLVRNSLDHGIEGPERRRALGKEVTGTITLRASHQGGMIVIEVSDDGRGLDRQRILAKAREKGLAVSETMSDEEVWALIFAPGFSTADAVTEVSGRGVGMDVVMRNVRAMGGSIEIKSEAGRGSTFRLRLPLTLAILDGMSVAVGDELYVIPLSMVIESLQPAPAQVKRVNGRGEVVQVREEYLPLLPLYAELGAKPRHADPTRGIVVVIESEGRRLALQVDELVGQQQFVIKNLERNYRRVSGISGATILGDGRVALILDPAGLARQHLRRPARAA